MLRVFESGKLQPQELFDQIFAEKRRLLRKAGYLEYVPTHIDVEQIGGMATLKEWAVKRRDLFSQRAVDAGLPIPKGVLLMGISGCGKSMSAKAIASLWRVPLFRLDMNLVFSGLYGTPEAAFHRALKSIESIAPAVLWIDEIESALGMTSGSASSEQSLTFSSFLTWMQERPPLVFVAATANRIESLPAEIIRKGRFDEVFFCDLPTETERREILRIHLQRNETNLKAINPDRLLHSTRGWSGAEIEQAVIAARIDALQENREMTLEDVWTHTTGMVPLSETMAEQVQAIREWSKNRAKRTSPAPRPSMLPV
jgi:SpoVK/Ycf46/Vps4 family AAA+-type ATPase